MHSTIVKEVVRLSSCPPHSKVASMHSTIVIEVLRLSSCPLDNKVMLEMSEEESFDDAG